MVLNKSYKWAETVLSVLEIMLEEEGATAHAQTYRNGRENGFCITLNSYTKFDESSEKAWLIQTLGSGRVCHVCNLRNSDGIAVYRNDENSTDDVPLKAFKSMRSFSIYDVSGAARCIFEYLKKGEINRVLHPDYVSHNESIKTLARKG